MKIKQKPEPGREARAILAANVKKLMEMNPALDSHIKLGARARIAARSVGYLLSPTKGNPTIDNIAKVAAVFGLHVWQLLHPDMPARAMSKKEEEFYETLRKSYEALGNSRGK